MNNKNHITMINNIFTTDNERKRAERDKRFANMYIKISQTYGKISNWRIILYIAKRENTTAQTVRTSLLKNGIITKKVRRV